MGSRSGSRIITLAAALSLGSTLVRAGDCNENGIDDAIETRRDQVGFETKQVFVSETPVEAILTADMDSDGRLDVISRGSTATLKLNFTLTGGLAIYLQHADGRFERPASATHDSQVSDAGLGDGNQEGRTDAAMVTPFEVVLIQNAGSGILDESQRFVVGSGPRAIAAADVDGDQRLAIVTGNSPQSPGSISVLIG